jgi:transcription antitermination factor NusG
VPELSGSATPQWYALNIKPRVERHVSEVLASHGFEVFLPTQQLVRRRGGRLIRIDKPLFPRYLFARFHWADRLRVITSPGILSVVTFSGIPATLSVEEINRLRLIVSSAAAEACDRLENGAIVRIASGPLQGLEGRLVETKSSRRLVINVDILHRAVSVVIDRADVVAAAARAHGA